MKISHKLAISTAKSSSYACECLCMLSVWHPELNHLLFMMKGSEKNNSLSLFRLLRANFRLIFCIFLHASHIFKNHSYSCIHHVEGREMIGLCQCIWFPANLHFHHLLCIRVEIKLSKATNCFPPPPTQ